MRFDDIPAEHPLWTWLGSPYFDTFIEALTLQVADTQASSTTALQPEQVLREFGGQFTLLKNLRHFPRSKAQLLDPGTPETVEDNNPDE